MRLYECPNGHNYGVAGFDEDLTNHVRRKGNCKDCPTCRAKATPKGERTK